MGTVFYQTHPNVLTFDEDAAMTKIHAFLKSPPLPKNPAYGLFLPQACYFIPIGEHHVACLGKKIMVR